MTGLARSLAAWLLCLVALPASALDLALPSNARVTATRNSALEQESFAVGPYANDILPVRTLEGPVTRRAYRIPSSGLTPLQILAPLRAQLEAADFTLLLDCDETSCGGFDFRFGIDVLPAPNMYVNIRAYHFVSAVQPSSGAAITLLASTAAGAGYLQVVQIGTSDTPSTDIQSVATPYIDTGGPDGDVVPTVVSALLDKGFVVLRSLDFEVGATSLGQAEKPDLAAIADLLNARPGLRVAVVGHTDTAGGLDANINVSRARAESVRDALVDLYGAPADRIDARGMGYLSPVANNLTPEGREANRRVEVILVSDGE